MRYFSEITATVDGTTMCISGPEMTTPEGAASDKLERIEAFRDEGFDVKEASVRVSRNVARYRTDDVVRVVAVG